MEGGPPLEETRSPDHTRIVKEDPKLGHALTKEKVQISTHEDGAIYLRNSADDPDAPRSWPLWKKVRYSTFSCLQKPQTLSNLQYCIVGLAA